MHQDGRTLLPGSGFPDEMGGPNAFGSIVNLPMPPETCEEGFLYTLDNIVMPLLDDFKPDVTSIRPVRITTILIRSRT